MLHSPVPPVWISIALSSLAKYFAAPVEVPLRPSCDEPSMLNKPPSVLLERMARYQAHDRSLFLLLTLFYACLISSHGALRNRRARSGVLWSGQ